MARLATGWRRLPLAVLLLAGGCEERDAAPEPAGQASSAVPADAQRVAIRATAEGFEPAEVHVTQGKPAVLEITRTVASSCVDAVTMPWREKAYDLPLNEPVDIVIPDTSKSGTFVYSCWMNMVHGKVVIDPTSPP